MTLSDPELAQLVQDAVDSVERGLSVRIEPAANDDPYRWGSAGWTVTVHRQPAVVIWIPADASPRWAYDEIVRRLRPEVAR